MWWRLEEPLFFQNLCFFFNFWICFLLSLIRPQVAQARNMSIGRTSALLCNIRNSNGFSLYIRLYREKNRLLYNPLNGHKSAHGPHRRDVTYVLCKVSCFFYWNPFIFVGYRNNRFSRYKSLYFECYTTMPMSCRCSYFELGLPVIWQAVQVQELLLTQVKPSFASLVCFV